MNCQSSQEFFRIPAKTQKVASGDQISAGLTELAPVGLTDLLIKVCITTLEKNRGFIDGNDEIRSINLNIKVSDAGRPYKVFLTPTQESHPTRHH